MKSLLSAVFLSIMAVTLPMGPAIAASPDMAPVAVIVEPVGRQRMADSLEALGTLQANESVRVTANVSDTISRINFQDGQTVEAGDVLAELTDAEEAALLAEAESLAEEAQRQYERIQRLVVQGNASESLLDERRREWRTAEARVNAVRSRLDDRIVTAPFSGRVGLRRVSPGALVSPGDVITTLVDDSRMKLDFTVPALYLNTVRQGTLIEASSAVFPNRSFAGEVSSVDSTIDPVTRSITVRAIIPNDERILVPGMLMTLNLLRNEREAIVISEEAVIPRGDRTFVMVVNTDQEPYTADERQIRLGTRMPGQVEVVSGLEVGEQVISHGTIKVRSGSPVYIKAVDDGTRPIAEMLRADSALSGEGA
jgi:membrane fusion protein, multidrug efflux system